MVVWGLGFRVLNWVFENWGFQLIGVGASGVGPSGIFWAWGSLYKHRKITLGIKMQVCHVNEN